MTLLTIWPYLLTIPALLVGMALGWQIRSARLRRELANRGTPLSSAAYAHTRLKDKHIDPEGVKHELEFAELCVE